MYLLETQVDCVKNEIKRRKKYYPTLVEQGRMTTEFMEKEIGRMQAVLQTLAQLQGILKGSSG